MLCNSFYATSAEGSAKGLALAPIRTEAVIAPGWAASYKLNLTNYSDRPMAVALSAEEFSVVDQQYNYAFDARSDISKWVTFDKTTVQLEPGKNSVVAYTVNVPQDAEPGGRYISLFAASNVQSAPGEIRTEQRIASLLYVTVKGDVTRIGSLKSLAIPFVFDGYQPWKIVIANSGTTHFRSKYSVSIRNIFDGKEVASIADSALVLPHTSRAIVAPMPVLKYLGIYRAVYTVGLGDSPARVRESYMVFLPKQLYLSLLSLTVIVVGGLSYVGWKIVRRKRAPTS